MQKAFLPFSIASGLAAGQLAKKIFNFIWLKFNDEEAPKSKHREVSGAQLVLALIIQGAIFQLVKGLVDHGLRHGWRQALGEWPGEERPEAE
jgi:hypothetical protein